jgi:hypothetical protein
MSKTMRVFVVRATVGLALALAALRPSPAPALTTGSGCAVCADSCWDAIFGCMMICGGGGNGCVQQTCYGEIKPHPFSMSCN